MSSSSESLQEQSSTDSTAEIEEKHESSSTEDDAPIISLKSTNYQFRRSLSILKVMNNEHKLLRTYNNHLLHGKRHRKRVQKSLEYK